METEKTAKKKDKTKVKCPRCSTCELNPPWGHTLCIHHRDCTGRDNWEPDNCTTCKRQKDELAKVSDNDRLKLFQEMYEMLENTKQYKHLTVKLDWEYEGTLREFLHMYELPEISTNNEEINNTLNEQGEEVEGTADNRTGPTECDEPPNEEEYENISP